MILPARSAASARICSPRHNTFYRRQDPSRRLFCNMDIKVYFAGSIRGGRADAALYRELIAHIKKSAVVLTEHVGDTSLSALERGPEGDRAIYEQDTAWLRECDIVIAECTRPSLGVGYELAYAEKLGKPCFLLYRRSECALSAMLTGDPYFTVIPYETREQALAAVDAALASVS